MAPQPFLRNPPLLRERFLRRIVKKKESLWREQLASGEMSNQQANSKSATDLNLAQARLLRQQQAIELQRLADGQQIQLPPDWGEMDAHHQAAYLRGVQRYWEKVRERR